MEKDEGRAIAISQRMIRDEKLTKTHKGGPTMNAATRQRLQEVESNGRRQRSNGDHRSEVATRGVLARETSGRESGGKARDFVAAETRLLREALARMVGKLEDIEVVGNEAAEPFRTEDLLREKAEILLLTSRGTINEDLLAIRKVRLTAPEVQILLIGMTGETTEFLQCVRAGVRGYLPRDASAEHVMEGGRALQAGEAVCPGVFCGTLFQLPGAGGHVVSRGERAPTFRVDAT